MNKTAKKKKSRSGCLIVGLGFLALFCVCALALGIWISQLRRHHQVAERVARDGILMDVIDVGKLGVDYSYSYTAEKPWPRRFADGVVGEKAFDTIDQAHLKGTQGKADLRYVAWQPGFRYLSIQGKEFDDADMAHVAAANELFDVAIYDVNVTQQGLAELKHCPALRHASLGGDWLSGDTLAGIAGATQLETLIVQDAAINSDAFQALKKLKRLKKITLSRCHIQKGSGLKHLASLPALKSLTLEDTAVPAAEINPFKQVEHLMISGKSWSSKLPAALAKMDSVNLLALSECSVTDADLVHIAKMKNLAWVLIESPELTMAGVLNLLKNPKLETILVESPHMVPWKIRDVNDANPKVHVGLMSEWHGLPME